MTSFKRPVKRRAVEDRNLPEPLQLKLKTQWYACLLSVISEDLLEYIFSFLDHLDFIRVSRTCHYARRFCIEKCLTRDMYQAVTSKSALHASRQLRLKQLILRGINHVERFFGAFPRIVNMGWCSFDTHLFSEDLVNTEPLVPCAGSKAVVDSGVPCAGSFAAVEILIIEESDVILELAKFPNLKVLIFIAEATGSLIMQGHSATLNIFCLSGAVAAVQQVDFSFIHLQTYGFISLPRISPTLRDALEESSIQYCQKITKWDLFNLVAEVSE